MLTAHLRCWQQAPGWDAVHQRTIQLKVLALAVHHPDPCAGYVRHVTHDEIADAIG